MMRFFLCAGGFFALLGVASRALSSHALHARLSATDKLAQFNLASDYLLLHGLALVAAALLCRLSPGRCFPCAGWAFILGCLLFPGTVFIKCFAPMGAAGILTPIGGACLMLGWLLLALGGLAG